LWGLDSEQIAELFAGARAFARLSRKDEPESHSQTLPLSKSKELLVHRRRLVIDAKAVEVAQSKVGDREQLDAAQAAADALIAGKPDEKPDPEPEPQRNPRWAL
jgi:hypothetical protein